MLFSYKKKLINLNQTKMRTGNLTKKGFLLSCIFFSLIAHSQEPKTCGPYKINQAAFDKALQFEKSKSQAAQNALSSTILMRVYFHIVTDDDGTNAAATVAQISNEFNTLASNYSPDNLCFLNAGFNHINSTFLNNNFNADTDPASDFDSYQIPNCINIFYMKTINGSNASCGGSCGYGGIALGGIPGTYCLISSGNIAQGQTISHEVGHCMGLLHTFEPVNGYEDIDGSNSTTAADLIGDTPADPFAYKAKNNTCFTSSNQCTYNGTCTDPKGQTNYSPPYTNLMAYWWANSCYFALQITSNQFTRVNSFLTTNAALQQCEATLATANISNVNVSSGYYFAAAVTTLNSGDNVNISGNTISTLGAGNVVINPGFDAAPSGNGLVLIRIDQCGDAESFSKKDNKLIAQNSKIELTANSITAYPNPTSSAINLAIKLAHNESKLSVRMYDITMKAVKEISLENLLKGSNTITVDLSKFSSGMYVVTVQGTNVLMRTMIVLQK